MGEGVKSIMGRKVLEYEAKTIRNDRIKEGIVGTVSILQIGYLITDHRT